VYFINILTALQGSCRLPYVLLKIPLYFKNAEESIAFLRPGILVVFEIISRMMVIFLCLQLHSEYRSTYRWHEYVGQEVVRRPPQPSASG